MALDLLVTLVAGFLAVALVAGYGTSSILAALSPERRRLRQLATAGGPGASVDDTSTLVDRVDPRFASLPGIPKSPKEMGRLRRRLAMAGYTSPTAVVLYALANLVTPVLFGLVALAAVGVRSGWILALFAAAVGYLLPGMLLARKIERRKREIREGLPDALDLFIVCVEAGSGLDKAIVKASDELGLTYPALAYELRLITTEIRAGKPRVEAFRNFAARTKVDDVQSLVALLVQTDKFGTSLAQALRTHADTSRTKRRQNAEERAGKLGVKLVFPLVLFLFPALYIVILGPAVITFLRVFQQLTSAFFRRKPMDTMNSRAARRLCRSRCPLHGPPPQPAEPGRLIVVQPLYRGHRLHSRSRCCRGARFVSRALRSRRHRR